MASGRWGRCWFDWLCLISSATHCLVRSGPSVEQAGSNASSRRATLPTPRAYVVFDVARKAVYGPICNPQISIPQVRPRKIPEWVLQRERHGTRDTRTAGVHSSACQEGAASQGSMVLKERRRPLATPSCSWETNLLPTWPQSTAASKSPDFTPRGVSFASRNGPCAVEATGEKFGISLRAALVWLRQVTRGVDKQPQLLSSRGGQGLAESLGRRGES